MKCPACTSVRLDACEPEPGMKGHECSKCHGRFVAFESFFAWQSRQGGIDAQPHVAGSAAEVVGPDSDGGKLCPGCGRFMTRMRVSLDLPFHIDRCGACAGMWFDPGEWEQLRARGLHLRLHALFAESWQNHLQQQQRRLQHEARYRALLGEEFYAKARDMKQWLDVHPQRGVVLAYLADISQD